MKTPTKGGLENVIVEYENLDTPPAYVESVQGMVSPNGVLHVSFFSERIKGLETLSGSLTAQQLEEGQMSASTTIPDPFGLDGKEIRLLRRVEANLIFTPDAIERLIPWLQNQLQGMRKKEAKR